MLIHEDNHALLCQQYLNIIYHDLLRPYPSTKKTEISETYGEILFESIEKILSIISCTKEDVFVDLGSGLGKVVLHFFLRTAVREAYGIEIIPELHQKALLAAEKFQQHFSGLHQEKRKLIFLLGSFLEIPLPTPTILLIGSPCFGPDMLQSLGSIIDKTPSIHTVITLRPVCTLQRLPLNKIIHIEGSWDSTLCYLYQK